MEIKVVTYNTSMIFTDSSSFVRAHKLGEVLSTGDWDIVGLCEVYHSSLRKIILGTDGIKKKYKGIVSNLKTAMNYDNGLVLLSKHPLKHVERYQYQSFVDKFYNRLLPPKDVVFAVATINGKDVGIFLTHLQWGSPSKLANARKDHITELHEFIDRKWGWEKPLLIMGDMNLESQNNNGDVKHFKKKFGTLQDWWHADHNGSSGFTWTPDNSKVILPLNPDRLDYILSNNRIKPKKSKILKFHYYNTKVKLDHSDILTPSQYIWYILNMTIFRILLLPIYLMFLAIFNLIRIVHRKSLIHYYSPEDLSDHYALEGTAVIN